MSFGEPWRCAREQVLATWEDADGLPHVVLNVCDGACAARVVACVNALAGIDPASVMRVVEAAKAWKDSRGGVGKVIAGEKLESALAALGGKEEEK